METITYELQWINMLVKGKPLEWEEMRVGQNKSERIPV